MFEGSKFPVPLIGKDDTQSTIDKIRSHTCSICLDDLFENIQNGGVFIYATACGHVFHKSCAYKARICCSAYYNETTKTWKSSKPCPDCRQEKKYCLDGCIFIDDIQSTNLKECVSIECKATRGSGFSHIFVNHNTKMMDVLKIYCNITGVTPQINTFTKTHLIYYDSDLDFCPDENDTRTLFDFSIKNGMNIELYLIYRDNLNYL